MSLKACFNWVAERLSSLISSPCNRDNYWAWNAYPGGYLDQLGTIMDRIQALIRDYEENPHTSSVDRLRLEELKDVAYDADDVLDEYAYRIRRPLIEVVPQTLKRKHGINEEAFVSVPKELSHNAEKILKEYDNINTQWSNLRLSDEDGDMSGVEKKKMIAPTSCLLREAEIFGRVDDKKNVLEMIFAENAELCPVSILPIVGMAGVGKTTLAQLVYNDLRVRESYDLHGWVFVGGNFDVEILTKKMIVSFTGKSCDLTELNELHKKMEEVVRGKKFFVVLDEVSNDTTRAWDALLAPLIRAQSGRIMLTAFDKEVAKIRQKRSSYSLGYLPYDDCWSLFRKLVFEDKEYPRPVFLKIGRSIVEKCKGLPLAVKAVGTTLYFENDEEKWNDMLKSDLWDLAESGDIIFPAMKLSYDLMPIHLKQCFVLFSLFPKGHVFSKDKMIRLWMSLGLLEESREKEDFGNRCVGELLRFSMIQDDEDSETLEVFSLHDFVQRLAQSVAGQDFMIMDKDFLFERAEMNFLDMHKKRHVSMVHSLANSIGFQILNMSKKLRILQLIGFNNHCMDIGIPNELFQNLNHLRALDFGNCVMKILPESIGNLIHLRYLVLTNTGIERLPEAVCHLYNLQTLDLKGCPIQELPKGIKYLVKLRHLNFENSYYIGMPRGIGQLKDLRVLPRFDIAMDRCGCKLSELNELVNLEGELCIGGLQNVHLFVTTVKISRKVDILRLDWSSEQYNMSSRTRTPWSSEQYNVSSRTRTPWSSELYNMSSRTRTPWSSEQYNMSSCTRTPWPNEQYIMSSLTRTPSTSNFNLNPNLHNHVFEMLKPNSALKELHIHKYCGSVFPSWLGADTFTSLVKLSLVGMQSCVSLPSLGQLPSLKTLSIQSLPSVRHVGREFCFGDGTTKGFPLLENLEFCDMLNWVEWFRVENVEFDSLSTLRIIDCPKLANLPAPFSSSLTKLLIKDCGELTKLPALPSLTSLTFKGELSESVFSYLDFPSLRTLKVSYSSNIEILQISHRKLLLLEILVIHSCRNLKSVSGFGGINSLKLFKVYSCRKVKFPLTEEIPLSVRHLDIQNCPMLKGWELFYKRKLIIQLNNDGGAEYEELDAHAELSEAESEDGSDADDSQ